MTNESGLYRKERRAKYYREGPNFLKREIPEKEGGGEVGQVRGILGFDVSLSLNLKTELSHTYICFGNNIKFN